MGDAIITLRKEETCQVLIRNVPDDHRRPLQEWIQLALSARGKDWEEDDIEVDSFENVDSGSDGMPEVEFVELKRNPAQAALEQIAESLGIDHLGLDPEDIAEEIVRKNRERVAAADE